MIIHTHPLLRKGVTLVSHNGSYHQHLADIFPRTKEAYKRSKNLHQHDIRLRNLHLYFRQSVKDVS